MSLSMRFALATLLFSGFSLPALADNVSYQVTIDTSSQDGNYGYIDLELNADSVSGAGPVVATVSDFSGATLDPSDSNNDELGTASGSLPGPLTLDNSGFNDYFEGMTFGSDITFDVTLSGAGVSLTDDAAYTSSSTLAAVFYDAGIANNLFVSDPDTGAAAELSVQPDGSVQSRGPVTLAVAATPEPGCLPLILSGCTIILLAKRSRRRVMHTVSAL
jgi:hypothetical protein